MQGFFITGTNTDAGKTVTTAALLRLLRRAGRDAIAAKPVQTGVRPLPGGALLAPDMEVYRQASGFQPAAVDLPLAFQYGFEPACSPHLAAHLAGEVIAPERIAANLRTLAARHEMLLVEGAGGLLVPLNQSQTMLDLARLLALPVILTVDNTLGMINHALLTLAALCCAGVPIAGVVVNHARAGDPDAQYLREDNIRAVESFGQVRILAVLPHLSGFDAGRDGDWKPLEDALRPGFADFLR